MQTFTNVTLGIYRRKTERAPVWLRSDPRSGLSKLIIVIHSWNQYLTASWQSALAQHTPLSLFPLTGKSCRWKKAKSGGFSSLGTLHTFLYSPLLFICWPKIVGVQLTQMYSCSIVLKEVRTHYLYCMHIDNSCNVNDKQGQFLPTSSRSIMKNDRQVVPW